MNTQNNPSQKKSPFWLGLGLIAIGVPFIFYLRFGRIDGYIISFTGFLILLSLAAHFVPKLINKYGEEQKTLKVARGRFDWLASVWLLSIPFAPFFAWIVSSLTLITLTNWKILLAIKAGLCVVIPCLAVLPMLKYIRGEAAPYSLLILLIGTGFPVSIGWDSMRDILQGPSHEQVSVVSVDRIHTSIRYQDVSTDILEVKLSDGRTLKANSGLVSIKPGSAEIIILEHLEYILDAK